MKLGTLINIFKDSWKKTKNSFFLLILNKELKGQKKKGLKICNVQEGSFFLFLLRMVFDLE